MIETILKKLGNDYSVCWNSRKLVWQFYHYSKQDEVFAEVFDELITEDNVEQVVSLLLRSRNTKL